MNSKEENSEDFCPNYMKEFGLWRKVNERTKKRHDNRVQGKAVE